MKALPDIRSALPERVFVPLLRRTVPLVCASLCSCMSVKYDMRHLDQPVTMNANPFACAPSAAPPLEWVEPFPATVSTGAMAGASSTCAVSGTVAGNTAETTAFKLIGGDPSRTITNVKLETESVGINALFAFGVGVKTTATGEVQKIMDPAPTEGKEPQ